MTEYIVYLGVKKQRWRCPKCGRSAPDNLCEVHGDLDEVLDLAESAEAKRMVREIITEEERNIKLERVVTVHGFHYIFVRRYEE